MPESKRRRPKPPSSPTVDAVTKAKERSPLWYVALMAGLMMVGVVLILFRFVFQLGQTVLVAGLAAIAAGFLLTTKYR